MNDDDWDGPPLPEHPELREVALAMEAAKLSGEITDHTWRLVFISTEEARVVGCDPRTVHRFYGKSIVRRQLEDGEIWATTDERGWWRINAPIMRHYLDPDEELFDEVWSLGAEAARRVEPAERAPRAWQYSFSLTHLEGVRRSMVGDTSFLDIRLNDDQGDFMGVVRLSGLHMPQSLMARLARGDVEMFERMDAISEPDRRPSGILFADLESSGPLARKLSSKAYFDLIRQLTDLIDSQVVRHRGIVGKHAGDGASALFVVEQLGGSESDTAAATISAARAIRDQAPGLIADDIDVRVNIGVHWGATLMVGQVATRGRLEVTALGDEMNEAARIQETATGGTVLASKAIVERLDPAAASVIDLALDRLAYSTLDELTSGDKALRDAGNISVVAI